MKATLFISALLLAALPLGTAARADDAPAKKDKPAAEASAQAQAPTKPAAQASEQGKAKAEAKGTAVARAVFTTEVVDHEPVDDLEAIPAATDRVYFFTEIVDRDGQTVTHRWLRDGEAVSEVPIEVGSPRWRAYSMQTIGKDDPSSWTVQVIDADGTVLRERKLPPRGPKNPEAPAKGAAKNQR